MVASNLVRRSVDTPACHSEPRACDGGALGQKADDRVLISAAAPTPSRRTRRGDHRLHVGCRPPAHTGGRSAWYERCNDAYGEEGRTTVVYKVDEAMHVDSGVLGQFECVVDVQPGGQ